MAYREGNLGEGAGSQLLLHHGQEPLIQDFSCIVHTPMDLQHHSAA